VRRTHGLQIKKRVFFAFLVLICSLAAMLAAGEVYIRYFYEGEYIDPGDPVNRYLQYEGSIFCRHVLPLYEQQVVHWGSIRCYINQKGYRGPDFQALKPDGVIRIMIYGGSAVFDFSSPPNQDWPHRVETILRQNGFPEVEVINAGIPGHASFDSFGRLFSEGHTFDPDYVVLYNAWNDIKYFRLKSNLLRSFHPYHESMDFRLYYLNGVDRFLGEHSELYLILREIHLARELRLTPEGAAPGRNELLPAAGDYGPEQYRINIEMFVELAHSIGAVPVLMTQARLADRGNGKREREKINYTLVSLNHEQLVSAFERTDEIIMRTAKTKHVIVMDASAHMSGKAEFFTDHVHLSEKGSEALAAFVAENFRKILQGPKEPSD